MQVPIQVKISERRISDLADFPSASPQPPSEEPVRYRHLRVWVVLRFRFSLLAVRLSSASSLFPTPQQNAESSKKIYVRARKILEEDYLDTTRAAGEYLSVRDTS